MSLRRGFQQSAGGVLVPENKIEIVSEKSFRVVRNYQGQGVSEANDRARFEALRQDVQTAEQKCADAASRATRDLIAESGRASWQDQRLAEALHELFGENERRLKANVRGASSALADGTMDPMEAVRAMCRQHDHY